MAPAKKGGEKKGWSTINVVVRENTPSTFTSASMEWVSKSVHLGHSKKSRSLPWRRREPRRCALTPGSTKPSGPKGSGMSHNGSVYGCPENVMKTKTRQTSSILLLPTCPSPPSKIYSQCGWELITDGPIQLLNCQKKKEKSIYTVFFFLRVWQFLAVHFKF